MDVNNCTYNSNNDSTEHGLSFKELQQTFRLCLQTEALIRLKGQSNDIGRSIPFLHLGAGSYKQVSIKGKRYKLHRIIWALANGRWPNPEMQVDHINRDPRNNHPDNLREVTASQNQRNRAANRETGLYGVYRSAGGYRVGVRCRIPDDHISQRRYPWFVARDIMYHAIEQFIQQAQGGQST